MPYSDLDPTDLEVGKPIKKKLFDNISSNFTDHESRMNNLEQGAGKIVVADFEVTGYISHYTEPELIALATHRAPCNYKLLEFTVTLLDSTNGFAAGNVVAVSSSSGDLVLELSKSTDGGINYYPITLVRPQIPSGKNGKGTSSRSPGCVAASFSDININQDDMLRVDLITKKDVQGTFHVLVYGSLD